MPSSKNIVDHLLIRQHNQATNCHFQRHFYAYPDLVYRLSLCAELQGHGGCVNCLQWNEKGTILASGSDDFRVILWDPFSRRKLRTIETGHINNIFSVQFAPGSEDRIVISGAGDSKVRVHDVNSTSGDCLQVYSCHFARVKRLAVARPEPNLVWSAGEDGLVMQFDLREQATCKNNCKHVLINLNAHLGPEAEIKCLAVNPCRPELMAVGANDPYVRVYDRRMLSLKSVKMQPTDRFLWDRSTALTLSLEKENYDFPESAVQYYIAGHLPVKCQDFRRRHRPLASTYVTFSPCGSNLLVNLGGEQIYLFDINTRRRSLLSDFRKYFDSSPCFSSENVNPNNGYLNGASTSNGYNINTTNGFSSNPMLHSNGFSKFANFLSSITDNITNETKKRQALSPRAEVLKQQANKYFESKNYNIAVQMYSEAIFVSPKAPVLYANRAAAYMKRDWDGDIYAALNDCFVTLQLDPEHLKAHFRLAKCLFDLKQYKSAQKCLEMFKSKFPDQSMTPNCLALDKEIIGAIFENQNEARTAKRKRNRSGSSLSEPDVFFEQKTDDSGTIITGVSNGTSKLASLNGLSEQELFFREQACDYDLRFCGHCNTTTDIKEANFFGSNGEYIIGGSDDGKFFIWDRRTCNIVRALIGDESIVNCLQPHPTQCLLASSGIDSTVKLWSPRPEDGSADMRDVPDQGNVAMANQRRMNADPLEVMLMNMGYRISGLIDASGGGGGGGGAETERPPAAVQCHQS